MRDVLMRLLKALPSMETWISDLHQRYDSDSTTALGTGHRRLSDYFPGSLLGQARAVLVDEIPFPPVATLGLPEFEGMAAMPMAGITFGHMYFLDRRHATESTHFHELVHVLQWATLGIPAFLSTYAVGILSHGYEASPFEAAAFGLEHKFKRGEAVRDLGGFIVWHAERTYEAAEGLFRAAGLSIGRRTGG